MIERGPIDSRPHYVDPKWAEMSDYDKAIYFAQQGDTGTLIHMILTHDALAQESVAAQREIVASAYDRATAFMEESELTKVSAPYFARRAQEVREYTGETDFKDFLRKIRGY